MFSVNQLFAQGQTQQKLANFYDTWLVPIVNIIFAIGVLISVVRVAFAFFQGGENNRALSKLGWLIGGVLLWALWGFVLQDLFSVTGSTQTTP
jgi:hypothetical protein